MTIACLTFDFDATAIWQSTFKQTSPTPISRGEYGALHGIPRVLALLKRHSAKSTFFVPIHTLKSFPKQVEAICKDGHEIGVHGLAHESPVNLRPDVEEEYLETCVQVLQSFTGVRPAGYRSPAWDLSFETIRLLEKMGFIYDSSLMGGDYCPYYADKNYYVGDDRYVKGEPSKIIEFPVAWELDDFPYFHFSWKPQSQGLRKPSDVLEMWSDEFRCADEVDGLFNLTCHPEVIGRMPRIDMLDKLISRIRSAGAELNSLSGAADSYRNMNLTGAKNEQ